MLQLSRPHTLIVDGLAVSVTAQDVRELFAPYGAVLAVHVASAPLGGSLGFGYVVMATEGQALEAVAALHGHSFGGRTIRVIRRDLLEVHSHLKTA
jgi:RNA recognition motif-containing protein